MYFDEHPPPHFHVYYQEHQAVMAINTLDVTLGTLPRRALSLVLEWALAHRDELRQNWLRAEAGEPLVAIEPLD
jgi:hypothetical protein